MQAKRGSTTHSCPKRNHTQPHQATATHSHAKQKRTRPRRARRGTGRPRAAHWLFRESSRGTAPREAARKLTNRKHVQMPHGAAAMVASRGTGVNFELLLLCCACWHVHCVAIMASVCCRTAPAKLVWQCALFRPHLTSFTLLSSSSHHRLRNRPTHLWWLYG